MTDVKKVGILEYDPGSFPSPHNPTPLEFDRFIPWVLTGSDFIDNIEIKRITIDDEPSKKFKKQSLKAISKKIISQVDVVTHPPANTETCTKRSAGSFRTNSSSWMGNARTVTKISAYYTTSGELVQVAFIKNQQPVPTIVLDAIRLCLPYHPQLTRVTWNGEYLTGALVCEISKMLMDSFLTEISLDNSGDGVPEKNYYILLDYRKLKYLSLRGCGVNDEACKKIAERIQRYGPGESLVALDLAVNCISDKGAAALGHALRTNRRLSFLNLCCNSITSDGAAHILLPLTKFRLNPDETSNVKTIRMEMAKQKIEAHKIYLGDITNLDKHEKKKRKSHVNPKHVSNLKRHDNTEKTTDSQGADDDIFMSNLVVSSGVWFSLGNLSLCSLNLAYNRLDVEALSMIADVLSYQHSEDRGSKSGLIRVVIEGNLLPNDSPKYNLIDKYMQLALNLNIPTDVRLNFAKSSRSLRSLHTKSK